MFQIRKAGDVLRPSKEAALEEWARRVRENREQAEHFREAPERPDFYAPTAGLFKADPHRSGDPALEFLCSLSRPGETWLDIGSGAGRNSLPLALRVREVIAVDPSAAMLDGLRQGMNDCGVSNIRIIEGRWPLPELPQADVSLISHVGYDIEDIGAFLEAMESASRRLCVALLFDGAPASPAARFWPAVHGEERVPLPALREFLVLQVARGRLCETRLLETGPQSRHTPETMLSFLRQQLFIEPGGRKDSLLQKLMTEQSAEQGGLHFPGRKPGMLGIVTWEPHV